jgi:molybdopterin molybdotransferase
MISIREAEKIIRENIPAPRIKKQATDRALGMVLAEDIKASFPSPGFTNSAMDGFAVLWDDVKNANEDDPITLRVVGESQAGTSFQEVIKSGEVVRINTGAMIPRGTDSVIPIEHCVDQHSTVEIYKVQRPNQNVRFKGEEFKKGTRILRSRIQLDARQLALLISLGITHVSVFKKPSVSIIVTGSELIDFKENSEEPHLRDTNSPMLSGLVAESGAETAGTKRVIDDLEDTIKTIDETAKTSDLVIVSGGVSVGPHDHVKEAAKMCGFDKLFWKINQKPGKPFFFAKKNNKLLFGLPGNPVSAYMGFYHYIRPVISVMNGLSGKRKQVRMKLGHEYMVKGDRTQLLRVGIKNGHVQVLNRQGSHMLTSISEADGYIIADCNKILKKDVEIDVFLFPERRP